MRNALLAIFGICLLACNQPYNKTPLQKNIDSTLKVLQLTGFQNLDSTIHEANKLLQLSAANHYSQGEASALLLLCSTESLRGNYKKALALADEALAKTDTAKLHYLTAEIYNEKGICYDYLTDYTKALDAYNNALQHYTLTSDTIGYLKVKNNIGIIYQNTSQLQLAKKYFNECLEVAKSNHYYEQEVMALSNLGSIAIDSHQPEEALRHFKKVLEYDIASGNEAYISYSYNNIAGAFKQLNNFDSAAFYYKTSIQLKEKLGLKVALLNSYKEYGDLLFQQNKIQEAEENLNRASEIADSTGTREYQQQCIELKARIGFAKGDYKKAYELLNTSAVIKDSLENEQFKTNLITKEKDYQLALKNYELKKLKDEKDYRTTITVIFILVSIALAILTVILFLLSRKTKKQNLLLADQQRELEKQNKVLEQQKKAVEEGLEMKNKFLSFLAHEIKNPLGGMIGLTDLLLTTEPTAEQQEYLNYQKKAGRNLLTLLDEVLEYQKIVSGYIQITKVKFNPEDTLQQVYQLYSGVIKEKHISFYLDYDHSIPPALIGDPIRLHQVLSNVLHNAIKFTPEHKSITIRARLQGISDNNASIYFAIEDTGVGIPENEKEKIFELYGQSSKRNTHQGTGLGLNIVKNILHLMDSKIEVKSQADKGSTFFFTIRFEISK